MARIVYDYSKLSGRIIEKFGTRANFASKLGINEATLSLKLGNKRSFKQDEIMKSMQLLDLPNEEVYAYFFK